MKQNTTFAPLTSQSGAALARLAGCCLASLMLLNCGGGGSGVGPGAEQGGSSGALGGAAAVGGGSLAGGVGITDGYGGAGMTVNGGASSSSSGGAGGSADGGSLNGDAGSNSASGGSVGGAGRSGVGRGGASSGGSSGGGKGGASNGCPNSPAGPPVVRATTTGGVFSQDRFHFGTLDSKITADMVPQLDFFTSGWLQNDTFDHQSVCNETKAGAALASLVPVQVAYISASHVKRQDKTVCDCNVTSGQCVATNDLCHVGAQRIAEQFPAILAAYKSYSQGFAACFGTTKPIVFELEPDWYQYTTSSETQPWTPAQAAQMLSQIVAALKSALPNARFSMDISPWVTPCNGGDNGKQWFANFDLSQFTFINTSGGGTSANTAKIRAPNDMTWAGVSQVTGKPILADTGYGVNGAPTGEDPLWNDPANINARIADGVVSISQYDPTAGWAGRIAAARAQLTALQVKP